MAEAEELASPTRFIGEPASRWTPRAFDDLLRWVKVLRASDIKVLPRRPVSARVDGAWRDVTRRPVQTSEIFEILTALTHSNVARSQIVAADDHDFAYEVTEQPVSETDTSFDTLAAGTVAPRIRFRGNATGCRDGWSLGAELTLRVMADRPPPMSAIGLSDAVYRACCPHDGLVLFTGITGTGKTTSMAAIIREINETMPWAIATYEQPIEYDLTNLPKAKGPLTQSEIPLHFRSFEDAARNAARRALDLVLVGEARDAKTLDAMLHLAEMGHRVFSTSHTLSVAATPLRIISAFPQEQHSHAAAALFTVMRMIVQQRLVERLDPETGQPHGRIALREYLEFDTGMRNRLMRTALADMVPAVERLVRAHGLPLLEDARTKHKAGLISDLTLAAVEYEYRDREENMNTFEGTAHVA